MTKTKAHWRRNLITFLCVILIFTAFFPISAFAYLQNASASVLFAWNKYITNNNPRITVYGRNPSTGAADNRTIISMNGLNCHYLYACGWWPVFCLNPDQAEYSNYVDGSASKATRWGRLTADQQDLILRALYCGYPITQDSTIQDKTGTYPMTAEHAQHLATQAMIFNIRYNYVVKSGNGIISTKDYNDAENFEERLYSDYYNFHDAYANLFARMNNFSLSVGIPSFATLSTETAGADKTIKLELDPATGNYTASVTDTNGVLSYYNFAGMSGGGITYSVSGNTLTITATPSAAESLGTATKKGNATSSAADVNLGIDNLTFYIKGGSGTDNYQTMVELVSSSATPTCKSVYLMLQADAHDFIEVEKRSSDTSVTDGNSSYSLEGAVFSIYSSQSDAEANQNAVGTITTDVHGNGKSTSLTPSTYYVRETTAPPGYELSDEIQTAVIPGGGTVTLNVEDPPITKRFTLKKSSANTGISGDNIGYSLEGAQYGVYGSEVDANADAHRIETLTADPSGNANSSKKYALGRTLFIKELVASPVYLLDTQVYTVTIANSNKNSVSVKEVPTGDAGHLRIRKVDGEDTELKTITESSAVFKVEFFPNADGSGTAAKTWYSKTADGIFWLDDPSYLDVSQTNPDLYLDAGVNVVFPIGTVKITEVTAPAGYVRTDSELIAHISQDTSGAAAAWHWATDAGGVISYEAEGATVENKLIRGNLEIIKKDKYEEIYLSGAGFRVYDSEGNQVKEGYTDTFGKLSFKNLPYGEYTYQEFKAPMGFELDDTVYPFFITEDGMTISHTLVNERRPGTIEVKKQDANGNPFAGVAFLLEYSTDEGSTWLPVFSRAANEKNITRGGCTSPGLTDSQLVTDETGKVRFTGLRADSKILYRLTETAAPEGYALMAGSLYVGTLPIETDNIYASDAEVFGSKAYVYTLIITATNDPCSVCPKPEASASAIFPLRCCFVRHLSLSSLKNLKEKEKLHEENLFPAAGPRDGLQPLYLCLRRPCG